MSKCIMTMVSEHYQWYIPAYVYALRTWFNEDIVIYVKGNSDPKIYKKTNCLAETVSNYASGFPDLLSTISSLRFTHYDNLLAKFDYIMITDADLLLYVDPFPAHIERIDANNPFAAHHGAWKRPHRPEICDLWEGRFERITGGMVCVTPEWYKRTLQARFKYVEDLLTGREGLYRECDEVILGRIVRESGMNIPGNWFPRDLIGIHLGDFKESMKHRYTCYPDMKRRISKTIWNSYIAMTKMDHWPEYKAVCCQNPEVKKVFDNLGWYEGERNVLG